MENASLLSDLRDELLTVLARGDEKLLLKKKEFNDMVDEMNKKPKKINQEVLWFKFSSILEIFPEDSRQEYVDRSTEEGILCKGLLKIIDQDILARKEELESQKRRGGMRNRRGAALRRHA